MLMKKFEKLIATLEKNGFVLTEDVEKVEPFDSADKIVDAADEFKETFKIDDEKKDESGFVKRVKATDETIIDDAVDKLYDKISALDESDEKEAEIKRKLNAVLAYIQAIKK